MESSNDMVVSRICDLDPVEYLPGAYAVVDTGDANEPLKKIQLSEVSVGRVKDGGSLTDAAIVDVPNNSLSTLNTEQSTLTLNVNLADGEVANFSVEITSVDSCILTVTSTYDGVVTPLTCVGSVDNVISSGKFYKVTCIGTCWTISDSDGFGAYAKSSSLAPDYSTLVFPIAENTRCTYCGQLYYCSVSGGIADSEDWTPAHWTATDCTEQINVVSEQVDDVRAKIGSINNGGSLTNSAIVNVPNNSVSTLNTAQSALTLNVNLHTGELANFAVEITASVACTLTVICTISGGTPFICKYAEAAGNTLEVGKPYQVTCVGSCWTLAEFVNTNVVTIGGRDYPVVIIGNKIWMAENLDYKFNGCTIGSTYSTTQPRGNYYNDDESTYGVSGNKYGLLYNKPAVDLLESNKSTLLPEGWHVPDMNELDSLIAAVGGSSIAGKILKSSSGWDEGNGTNDYNFSVYPTGFKSDASYAIGTVGFIASKTPIYDSGTYLSKYKFFSTSDSVTDGQFLEAQVPVRLVKDL